MYIDDFLPKLEDHRIVPKKIFVSFDHSGKYGSGLLFDLTQLLVSLFVIYSNLYMRCFEI
jgi:hypothetical protein